MSNQSYYGYSNAHNSYPQQPQYANSGYNSNSNYGHAQGGYNPPYNQGYDNRGYADYHNGQPEAMPGPDGERGLGATLVGGGAAGWTARKSGAGMLGSLASAAAGAVGANLLENKLKKHRNKKNNKH